MTSQPFNPQTARHWIPVPAGQNFFIPYRLCFILVFDDALAGLVFELINYMADGLIRTWKGETAPDTISVGRLPIRRISAKLGNQFKTETISQRLEYLHSIGFIRLKKGKIQSQGTSYSLMIKNVTDFVEGKSPKPLTYKAWQDSCTKNKTRQQNNDSCNENGSKSVPISDQDSVNLRNEIGSTNETHLYTGRKLIKEWGKEGEKNTTRTFFCANGEEILDGQREGLSEETSLNTHEETQNLSTNTEIEKPEQNMVDLQRGQKAENEAREKIGEGLELKEKSARAQKNKRKTAKDDTKPPKTPENENLDNSINCLDSIAGEIRHDTPLNDETYQAPPQPAKMTPSTRAESMNQIRGGMQTEKPIRKTREERYRENNPDSEFESLDHEVRFTDWLARYVRFTNPDKTIGNADAIAGKSATCLREGKPRGEDLRYLGMFTANPDPYANGKTIEESQDSLDVLDLRKLL